MSDGRVSYELDARSIPMWRYKELTQKEAELEKLKACYHPNNADLTLAQMDQFFEENG